MSEQLSLMGFEEPARPTDRLFFALLPDAASALEIEKLAQKLRGDNVLKGAPIAQERLHVTLFFVGDFAGLSQDVVASASRAAASLTVQAFDVSFDRVLSFKGGTGHRPLVLGGSDGLNALVEFQRTLTTALAREGVKPADHSKSFTPHVTLLYDAKGVAEQAVAPICWRAEKFVLIRSLIGRNNYSQLARWPFGR
jgi:2'-5' RNA ligase